MKTSRILFLIIFLAFVLMIGDSSAQWENISTGLGNRPVFSLYNNVNYIYAGSSNHGIYLSSNNGTNWSPAGVNYFNITYAMTEFGGYLYAACELGVWRTSNNGAYWSYTSLNNTTMYSLASNQSRVFVGSHNSGLFYSSGGTGWFISSLSATSVKALAIDGNFLVAGCGNAAGVYISTNNGNNWSSTTLNNKTVYSLAMNGDNIYAGTGSGVYYSTDRGTTWTHSSLNNELVYALAVDGSSVFAGTELHGIYISDNGGISWIQRNEGLGNITIHSLRVVNNFIFAGASANGVYRRQIGDLVGLSSSSSQIPNEISLSQNFPNPFNPTTTIKFGLNKQGAVNISIYDVTGKRVEELLNDEMKAGTYEVNWNASNYSSGTYFYTITAEDFRETKKMLLIK